MTFWVFFLSVSGKTSPYPCVYTVYMTVILRIIVSEIVKKNRPYYKGSILCKFYVKFYVYKI